MDKLEVKLIDVGRDRFNGEIEVEYGHNEFEIAGRVCQEARKHLMSRNIEVFFDTPVDGVICAGGRLVGKFLISN